MKDIYFIRQCFFLEPEDKIVKKKIFKKVKIMSDSESEEDADSENIAVTSPIVSITV